jgi:hypothetical protein
MVFGRGEIASGLMTPTALSGKEQLKQKKKKTALKRPEVMTTE